MSEAIDAIRDERNHWIGEAKKFERYWKSSNKDATRWLKERNEARERAERAEAELAALRERVRGLACSENAQVVLFGVTGTHPEAYGGVTKDEALECAEAVLTDLRHLLDDDTTGAASGEGEK